jgi:hypothetical protein
VGAIGSAAATLVASGVMATIPAKLRNAASMTGNPVVLLLNTLARFLGRAEMASSTV